LIPFNPAKAAPIRVTFYTKDLDASTAVTALQKQIIKNNLLPNA